MVGTWPKSRPHFPKLLLSTEPLIGMALLHVTNIEITSAENHELTGRFDDGTRRRVELETLLTGCFEPLYDPQRFGEDLPRAPAVAEG